MLAGGFKEIKLKIEDEINKYSQQPLFRKKKLSLEPQSPDGY